MSLYIKPNCTEHNWTQWEILPSVSVGLDFEETIIHWFIKAQINLLYKKCRCNTVIYRHWYDSPWDFCCILPKAAIIKPQMTPNNTTIDMAFRSSSPSGNKTISFLPMLKIKCTALTPSVRCLTSKLPFLVRMKIVLVLFFKINSSVFLSFLIHILINLRHSTSPSAHRALQVYTYACLCTPSHTPAVGFILFPVWFKHTLIK